MGRELSRSDDEFLALLRGTAGSPSLSVLEDSARRSQPCGFVCADPVQRLELARCLHAAGQHSDGVVAIVDAAELLKAPLDTILFGRAVATDRSGIFLAEQGHLTRARRGTLFIDRAELLSESVQRRLIHFLEFGTIAPITASVAFKADLWLLLGLSVRASGESEATALCSRLGPRLVEIPAMTSAKQLSGVIRWITTSRLSRKGRHAIDLSDERFDELEALLRTYAWPSLGAIEVALERIAFKSMGAEARHFMEDARNVIEEIRADRPDEMDLGGNSTSEMAVETDEIRPLKEQIEELEAGIIRHGMAVTHWNKSMLAKMLGISRSNLIQKCRRYGIE